jgi:hypothetical protein
LKAWQAKEDTWLAAVKQIEPSTITAAPLRAIYAIVRDALEGSVGTRACRYDSDRQPDGEWLAGRDLPGDDSAGRRREARQEALARWSRFPTTSTWRSLICAKA